MAVLEALQVCEGTVHGSEDVYDPGEGTRCVHGVRKTTRHRKTSSIYIERCQRSLGFWELENHLKDCPQRSVVFIQSSVKLTGSLRHSVARIGPIAAIVARSPLSSS